MAGKIETILVGTSLTEESDAVVRTGVALARAAGAAVHLVHASGLALPPYAPAPWPFGFDAGLAPEAQQAWQEAEERRVREGLAAQLGRLGLHEGDLAGQTIHPGVPHRVLTDLVRELDADLVVVGAAESGGLSRLLGSTADRVLRKAHRPVLVVRGTLPVPPARVLAPVDLSPLSAEAFRQGLAVLETLGPAPAVEALFVLGYAQRQVAPQFTPEQIDRLAAEELASFVERTAGSRVLRKVRVGNVREQILAEIAESSPDLVMIGTHGLGGFDRLVIGSVAADVAREAPVSVLVIPPASKSEEIREAQSSQS